MTVHAVVSAGADYCALDASTLEDLQWEQFQHDENYHREIARLTVHERWKHMALHFAKYAGKLTSARSEDETKRTIVDVFVIAMSTLNTLNVQAANAIAGSVARATTVDQFLNLLVISSGRMAAACEKLDHVEDYPFRSEVASAAADLLALSANFSAEQRWDMASMVRARLAGVKEKSIFHERQSRI